MTLQEVPPTPPPPAVFTRIDAIRRGMPIAQLTELTTRTGLGVGSLAEALRLNPRTLRRRTDRLNAEETEKFHRVFRVLDRATEVMDADDARRWLSNPAVALDGRRPIDLLDTDLGTEQVLNILAALDWGIYL